MEYLDSLQAWIKETALYNDFLLHMPSPLNNIYFDTILLAILLIYCGYRIVDAIQMSKRHRAVKERQLELKEKSAENEIHIINHEREARNQREEMNQFMRFMEMSMLTGATRQMNGIGQQPQTFDQFKEQENRARVEENRQKTQDAFDTIDVEPKDISSHNEPIVSPYDVAMTEFTQLENERINAELTALRIEKEQMVREIEEKESSRKEAIVRLKETMAKQEQEKQAEIDRLTKALSDAVTDRDKQLNLMVDNLNAYKANKEKEIADLHAKMMSSTGASRDEKQAEIDKLRAEMNRMQEMQRQAISDKENELTRELADKESQIASLSEEIYDVKKKNKADIDQLQAALQTAHEKQKAMETEKSAEIEQLTDEIKRLQKEKEKEIAVIKAKNDEELTSLQSSLVATKAKMEELNQASQEREQEIVKLQNMLADDTNSTDYDNLNAQIQMLRRERDAAVSDKKTMEHEITTLNERLDAVKASGQKQIEEKKAEMTQLASAKISEVQKPRSAEDKAVGKAISQSPSKTVSIPSSVTKPDFGGMVAATKDNYSDFDKLMAEFEHIEAKSQEMEDARISSEKLAKSNKEALEQQLVVEAKAENLKEIHEEDEAKLTAIEEQKRRVTEQIRREEAKRKAEEERAKNNTPKKKIGFPFVKK